METVLEVAIAALPYSIFIKYYLIGNLYPTFQSGAQSGLPSAPSSCFSLQPQPLK